MELDDERFRKWQEWMAVIERDITGLTDNQQIFLEFGEIVRENAERVQSLDGGIFTGCIRDCYVAQAVSGIRRHVKSSDQSASLALVISQVEDCASDFTYEFYQRQFGIEPGLPDWRPTTFAKYTEGGESVSGPMVRSDLDKLRALSVNIEAMGDRVIAHLDKRGFQGSVTFGDLKQAIDLLDSLACKYLALIKGEGYDTLCPVIPVNWHELFYNAWAARKCM